jgi:hypothetical protein
MHYQTLSRLPIAVGTRTPTPWISGWRWARDAARAALVETARYACGSPRARLHARAALRELDARLRDDIGLAADVPDVVPPTSFEGHR